MVREDPYRWSQRRDLDFAGNRPSRARATQTTFPWGTKTEAGSRLRIMNSTEWLNYYRNNSRNRTEPQWHVPCPLNGPTQRALAHSLSHFQLGESGEGDFLLSRAAREVPDDAAFHEALKLFVAE